MSRSVPVNGEWRGLERHGLVVDIDENANAIAFVEPPGDLRNVRCRVAIAEIGVEVGAALFREHFAVPGLVEPVHHHPIVAGQALKDACRLVAKHRQGAGGLRPPCSASTSCGIRSSVGPARCSSMIEAGAGRAMQQAIVGFVAADATARRDRDRLAGRLVEVRANPFGEIADDPPSRGTEERNASKSRRAPLTFALICLTRQIRLADQQQVRRAAGSRRRTGSVRARSSRGRLHRRQAVTDGASTHEPPVITSVVRRRTLSGSSRPYRLSFM